MGELKEPTEKQKAEGAKYIEQMRALQNYAEKQGKKRKQMEKFKVGDKVRSRWFGVGVVDEVLAPEYPYPITVNWTEGSLGDGTYSSFTLEGHYYSQRSDAEKDITLLEGEDKTETDAINPAHYRVEGIPEAIEIMQGLMTKEQFEGFLWGNLLKYAYRYGRKGDKKETAGKIAWYAKKLEEVVGNAAV